MADEPNDTEYLRRISRDLKVIRDLLGKLVGGKTEAESEVPEKIHRFMIYAHDINSMAHMYEERGLEVPPHILRELERLDDRTRHLLEDLTTDTGTFEKVRQDMAKRESNRWDHTRLLPKGTSDGGFKETGAGVAGSVGEGSVADRRDADHPAEAAI